MWSNNLYAFEKHSSTEHISNYSCTISILYLPVLALIMMINYIIYVDRYYPIIGKVIYVGKQKHWTRFS
jgi:hypothetical protein